MPVVYAESFHIWIVNGKMWRWIDGPRIPFYKQLRNMGWKQIHLIAKNRDYGIVSI